MTYDFGGMPFTPEMNSFQAEIGSNQGLVTGGDLQDGAVIPDAGCDPSSSGSPFPDARDQEFFGQRQGGINDIQPTKLEQAKSGAECPVLGGNPRWLQSIESESTAGQSCIAGLVATLPRAESFFLSLGFIDLGV
jgi:hypothetical protein